MATRTRKRKKPEQPPLHLEIEAPANGRIRKSTVHILDADDKVVMTDRADRLREVLTQRGQWLAAPPPDG